MGQAGLPASSLLLPLSLRDGGGRVQGEGRGQVLKSREGLILLLLPLLPQACGSETCPQWMLRTGQNCWNQENLAPVKDQ